MGYITQLRFVDLDAAIAFYVDHLDCELVFRYEDFYAGLLLDGQMIHFKLVDDPEPNIDWVNQESHLHLSLEVADLEAFSAALKASNVAAGAIKHEPWGSEFELADPGGHSSFIRQTIGSD